MIYVENEKECCGCGACSEVCPVKCINMKEGKLGHLFPQVDLEKCINCNKCEKVCPMRGKREKNTFDQKVYAAYSKDKSMRNEGSSGGIFGTFSRYLIKQDFIIYGAAFDKNLKLRCTKAKNIDELVKLMKSKYLQSDLLCMYKDIQYQLKNGKKVLFVSTPCQVSAIKRFLSKNYHNLITIDFFCHGVPSQKFFDQCLELEEKKIGGRVLEYSFRSKKYHGSTPHYYTIKYVKNGKIHQKTQLYFKSIFYAAFQKYICLRESCYNCSFSDSNRESDITIGDFHDIDKYIKGINRFDGISTVVLNTLVGQELWNECENDFCCWEMDIEQLKKDKTIFAGGTSRPEDRDIFVDDYENMEFSEFADKWMNSKKYWKQRIYYSMPKFVRRILIKVIGV